MAHFAELDENNLVLRVIVVGNEQMQDVDGLEVEAMGALFCRTLFGFDTRWVQTSYNGSMRKNYAGVGFTYDPERDAFIAPQPFPSWELGEGDCRWYAPVACPNDGKHYQWDEATIAWVEV